jgi:membrane protease YdiL (CAAX protease family)
MKETKIIKKRNPILVFFWAATIAILAQILMAVILIVPRLIFKTPGSNLIYNAFQTTESALLTGALSLFIAIPIFMLIIKYLWRRNNEFMALKLDIKKLLLGFSIGFILPVLILLILFFAGSVEISFNPYDISASHIAASIFASFALMLFIAYEEEIVFRGMLFREWASKGRIIIPTVLSGLIFGIIHVYNIPNRTPYTIVAITISGLAISILLTALYMRFKSLWASIGYHIGWNFIIIAILGTPVSGINTGKSLFITKLNGPIILTGGVFGIEISIIALLVVLLAVVFILKYPFKEKIEFMNIKIPEKIVENQNDIIKD